MTTDSRTNDPRQESAAKLHEMFPGYVWSHYLNAADALALVAAQGATPVQPSSTVDELAGVIRTAWVDWHSDEVSPEVSSDVFLARAVVEAIGGESRG